MSSPPTNDNTDATTIQVSGENGPITQEDTSRNRNRPTEQKPVPELTTEYWFQLSDQFSVEFAVGRILDQATAEERESLAIELLAMVESVGECAREGLYYIWDFYIVSENLSRRLVDPVLAPVQHIACLARMPTFNITGEYWLEQVRLFDVITAVQHIMAPPGTRDARGTTAFDLEDVLLHLEGLADKAVAHIWEDVICAEELWQHCGSEAELKAQVDFDYIVGPAVDACNAIERRKRSSRECIRGWWGEAWEEELDPTERWLPRGSETFLDQLAHMVTHGSQLHDIRRALDEYA